MTNTTKGLKDANTAQVAEALNTTPRELRKFLRSPKSGVTPVGKGSRYSLTISAAGLGKMRKQFAAWSAEQEAQREAYKAAKAAIAPEAVTEAEADEVDEELEPTDEDLEDIADEV